jgi:hypothetical protein
MIKCFDMRKIFCVFFILFISFCAVYSQSFTVGRGFFKQGDTDNSYCFAIALSDSSTELTTSNGDSWDALFDYTIDSVRVGVNKAPTGSTLTVEIKQDGTTIFTTPITIDANEFTSVTAATPYVLDITSISYNDRMQAYCSSVGSTYGGAGIKVYIYGTKD